MKHLSNLDIMREADAFPYEETEAEAHAAMAAEMYTLVWRDGQVLGYVLSSVVQALLAVPEELRGPVVVDEAKRTVRAFEQPTEPERTRAVDAVMRRWRAEETFAILKGWREEPWPVYVSRDGTTDSEDIELVYSVERSGAGLLGVMRYGVHMTGYVTDDSAPYGIKLWVPRRAATKSTYPGMLDNTVAGGLMTGEVPFECMVREADEEASLPADLMRERCRYVGMVSYIYVTDPRAGGEAGQVYPETQWVYDLELPNGTQPVPKDGEVAEFYLWTVPEVQEALARGEFKPNTALVVLDFFIRHQILNPDNEPHYAEVARRMHRRLPFPGPHQNPPPVTTP
ncbi:NUDIX hydrolase domain-like protein [Xylariomycetidae sp. FL0641]|nr:NUDIX hydrolase domain-like protein [Xylariomycetidae sp. FL0641]